MNRVAQPVPAASCGSVPLLARTPGGTPGELAGADACATSPNTYDLNSYQPSCVGSAFPVAAEKVEPTHVGC